ncbi:Protein-disulfide isomerase [Marinobacter segnicrescens]|uniref:Protein-disulfide isomerase n=1 Tax=Marinobacter segnicrescens TaxID=430453 RepID=A0A1I0CD75_9GAMM|nr:MULTISPECIES: thioredoxin domain-containing protein [Marinobacter]UZD64920.1 DsbA family protein [Marinobacter sp. AN1]SET17234.1 Protein-disulfide isomerase [Marinobacter segnicrescens]
MGEAKRRQQTGSPSPRKRSRMGLVFTGLVIIAVAVVAVLYYLTQPSLTGPGELPDVAEDTPAFPSQLDRYGVSVGSDDAEVVVREFADYQCPACARFANAGQRLKEEYVDSGEVRFVFFDLPLPQHTHAMAAAMAARCAGDQDGYWAMHDRLFEEQSNWESLSDASGQFSDYADDLGLDTRRFNRCMESELHREAVEESRQVARQLQVASTPTVLVNNIPLNRPGWEQLSAVVERELNEQ